MDDPAQAAAYAGADFSDAHQLFVRTFHELFPGTVVSGEVLDLGCGTADVTIRFARSAPFCRMLGVDGAQAMLEQGRAAVSRAALQGRIELTSGVLQSLKLPRRDFQAILSNSLLHHLHDPAVLWNCIKQYSAGGTLVFVMDLVRPDTRRDAHRLVNLYCENGPEMLRRDFYNSLCAAFLPAEVEAQLQESSLPELTVKVISDRHWIAYGTRTHDIGALSESNAP